jgi:hypothetical protein
MNLPEFYSLKQKYCSEEEETEEAFLSNISFGLIVKALPAVRN